MKAKYKLVASFAKRFACLVANHEVKGSIPDFGNIVIVHLICFNLVASYVTFNDALSPYDNYEVVE